MNHGLTSRGTCVNQQVLLCGHPRAMHGTPQSAWESRLDTPRRQRGVGRDLPHRLEDVLGLGAVPLHHHLPVLLCDECQRDPLVDGSVEHLIEEVSEFGRRHTRRRYLPATSRSARPTRPSRSWTSTGSNGNSTTVTSSARSASAASSSRSAVASDSSSSCQAT